MKIIRKIIRYFLVKTHLKCVTPKHFIYLENK
jgi:hypothetical protein